MVGMTAAERQNQVSEEIWERIEYLKVEYNVTLAEMFGILGLIQMDIYIQSREE